MRSGRHVARERRHDRTVREIEAARIDALLTKQPPRRRDARVGDAWQGVDLIDRVRRDHVGGEPFVEYAVDEGLVGSVLEQPAHEVRQQILMLAHRGINTTRPIKPFASHDLRVELLAHAVQPLELEAAIELAAELRDVGHGVRVVRRELRVDPLTGAQQPARKREIGDIGVAFARVDRVSVEATLLRALDLAVPVGALDEPHVEPTARPRGERPQPVDHGCTALLIRLDGETEAVPAVQLRRAAYSLDQLERQLESTALLRIRGEGHTRVASRAAELEQPRAESIKYVTALAT